MRRRFCYNHFIKQRKNAESGADMEQNAIKTVAFGGFDKEDVARCIEKLSQETDAVRSERDALQEQGGPADAGGGDAAGAGTGH